MGLTLIFLLANLSLSEQVLVAETKGKKIQIEGKYYDYNPENIYDVNGRRVFFKIGNKGAKIFKDMPLNPAAGSTENKQPTLSKQPTRSDGQPKAVILPGQTIISADQKPPVEPLVKNNDQLNKTLELPEPTDGVDGNDLEAQLEK